LRAIRSLLAAPLVAIVVIAGCQIVAGLDGDFREADAGAADAGADASSGCASATYPDPPGGKDDGVDIGPVVVAVHSMDIGDMNKVPGYDLDHVCTCTADAGPSCVGRATSPATYCDEPGGVDNQAAKIFKLASLVFGAGFDSQSFTTKINDGRWSLLIVLTGYNGESDDPSVQVALYPSPGIGAPPLWDGSDSWPILTSSRDAMGNPLFVSKGAYVSNKTLVATVPTAPMTFAGDKQRITIQLSAAVLTGSLTHVLGQWHIANGVLAGRWSLAQTFQSISSYRDDSGNPICTDATASYNPIKKQICSNADILVDDTQPNSTMCDAISLAMGFNADPALIGSSVAPQPPSNACPAATDPANDSCP
jgi:hypothetical protein